MSELEATMLYQIQAAGLPMPYYDPQKDSYQFPFKGISGARRFRFDFAYPDEHMLAVECDGGTWIGGRHASGSGIETDSVKYCEAAVCGWRILRFTRGMIESGVALNYLEKALNGLES